MAVPDFPDFQILLIMVFFVSYQFFPHYMGK